MVSCPKCQTRLPDPKLNSGDLTTCGSCGVFLRADVFPALRRSPSRGRSAQAVQMEQEAGCFYHPKKRAVVDCCACGRFVCGLCDVTFNGRHLCPACFEKGITKRKIKSLENRRTCYDTIALLVAAVPVLMWFATIVTAPLAIFLVIRHWNAPLSITPRSRIRFVLAFLLAGFQIAAWIFVFVNPAGLKLS